MAGVLIGILIDLVWEEANDLRSARWLGIPITSNQEALYPPACIAVSEALHPVRFVYLDHARRQLARHPLSGM